MNCLLPQRRMKRDFEEKKKKESGEDISPATHVRIVAALKLSALNKKVSGNKCIPIKAMWENKLHEML